MDAIPYQTLSLIALGGFLLAGVCVLANGLARNSPKAWLIPAALSGLLAAWSAFTIAQAGPLGFWPHHVGDAWGVQIWFDLLLGVGVAFALLVPRARALGMQPAIWFIAVACTGSIGLLAMLSRCLVLQHRAAPASGLPPLTRSDRRSIPDPAELQR